MNLGILLAGWVAFYFLAKYLKLDRHGFEVRPYYVMFKSTILNDILLRIGGWHPGFWRILGNMAIVSFFYCSCQEKVPSLQEQYYSAILDATTAEADEISSDLIAITDSNDYLTWKDQRVSPWS